MQNYIFSGQLKFTILRRPSQNDIQQTHLLWEQNANVDCKGLKNIKCEFWIHSSHINSQVWISCIMQNTIGCVRRKQGM